MKVTISGRGFEFLTHPAYTPPNEDKRLASQSSAIGDYDDAMSRPGSSFLWIGDVHHLNREEVAQFIEYLKRWLATGYLGEEELDEVGGNQRHT